MNLSEIPSQVIWPSTHYVYVEKIGPFNETAQKAWQQLHGAEKSGLKIKSAMALYKIKPEMVYRAGFILESKPEQIPPGLQYENFAGGNYAKFTLVGSYSQLPSASGKVFERVNQQKIQQRDDFNIEHYANNPQSTAEAELITEILIPTK